MTAGRMTRFARPRWIVAATLIGATVPTLVHPDARAEEPLRAHGVAALNRLGRSLGIGYSDGYHSVQWRPANVHGDRPPESYWARRPDTAPVVISHPSPFHPHAVAPAVSDTLDAPHLPPYHDQPIAAPPVNPLTPLSAAPSGEYSSSGEIEQPPAQKAEPKVVVPQAELPTPQNPPEPLPKDPPESEEVTPETEAPRPVRLPPVPSPPTEPPATEPPTPTPTSAPSAAPSPSDRPAAEAAEVDPVEQMPEKPAEDAAVDRGELLWPPSERADEVDPLDEFGDEPLAEITRLPPPHPQFSAPVRLSPPRTNPVPVRLPPVTR